MIDNDKKTPPDIPFLQHCTPHLSRQDKGKDNRFYHKILSLLWYILLIFPIPALLHFLPDIPNEPSPASLKDPGALHPTQMHVKKQKLHLVYFPCGNAM